MSVQSSDMALAELQGPGSAFDPSFPLSVQRVLDVIVCVLASPFAVIVGALIFLIIKRDGGSAIYAQRRVGRGGRIFNCFKFRSMVPQADARLQELLSRDAGARAEWEHYQKLTHDPRITRIGRFLRGCSLDELPQLINVCRGEMSIVGPRPILTEQVSLYGEAFGEYCLLRPGLTGLWQIAGRNDCTFAERVRFDVEYVRTRSVWRDIRIILLTFPAVFAGRGAK